MNPRGVTLLETMVALVILGIAVAGFLELFGGGTRLATASEAWSQAVTYAEQMLEEAKLDRRRAITTGAEPLPGGFARSVEVRPWSDRLQLVTVVVTRPGMGELRLTRLMESP